MTRSACGATVALLLVSLALPAMGQNYFLYTPQPVAGEGMKRNKGDVLVREITVEKGDTLSALSRKFSGRASYFPQILLFNDIRNPNLIHIGDNIKVPFTKGEPTERRTKSVSTAPQQAPAAPAPKKASEVKTEAQSASELSLSELKQTAVAKGKNQSHRTAAKKQHKQKTAKDANSSSTAVAKVTAAGQKLYDQAYAAYRQGNCSSAIELFDRYLAANPTSSRAADASLYKADCYLKLSGQ